MVGFGIALESGAPNHYAVRLRESLRKGRGDIRKRDCQSLPPGRFLMAGNSPFGQTPGTNSNFALRITSAIISS